MNKLFKPDGFVALVSTEVSKGDYQFQIPKAAIHLSGHFLKLKEKTNEKAYFHMESIVYPQLKILEGPDNYFMTILMSYSLLRAMGLFICETFFLSVPFIICRTKSFSALLNISG